MTIIHKTKNPSKVVAISVAYNPLEGEIARMIASTLPQVAALVLVDNGSRQTPAMPSFVQEAEKIHFLPLGDNLGIATALNRGISKARKLCATHVLLLDQDSEPDPDCVTKLLEAHINLMDSNQRVAAVGPCFYDPRHGKTYPFLRIRGWWLEHAHCPDAHEIISAEVLITSGSLISLACLDEVGPMDEDLFIYYVDNEWCLRAQARGYRSFGICSARMAHRHGESSVRILGRHIPIRTPLMHYYLIRNAVLLYRRSWVPWRWRLIEGIRVSLKFFLYAIIIPPRLLQLRMMSLGLWHGLRGWGGRFDRAGQ